MDDKIFVINPGSTSTKIALYQGRVPRFARTLVHDEAELKRLETIPAQLPYRMAQVERALDDEGLSLAGTRAYATRTSGLAPCKSGVYLVNDLMLTHARMGYTIMHPASLGCQMAHAFQSRYGGLALVVDPPESDERDPEARLTGLKGIYRECHMHVLSHKAVARRYAASVGQRYEDMDLVVAHLGGGITVAAHRHGRIVDANDGAQGDGPMAPTRAGALPAAQLIKLCFEDGMEKDRLISRVSAQGGWLDHLGTSDLRKVLSRAQRGDREAALVYRATVHQVVKAIGAYAAVLGGSAQAIVLTGGLMHSPELAKDIGDRVRFLAPVTVYPGEFEMEALVAGAMRVLSGQEAPLTYTGDA